MTITNLQKNNLKKVGDKYDLKLILLHGSYAKGEERVGSSDLDIAVLTKKGFSQDSFLSMYADIASVLGNTEERELDLKLLNRKDPLFLYEVVRNSKLLYGDETEYDEFCAYAFKYYFDAAQLFELEDVLLEKKRNKLINKYA